MAMKLSRTLVVAAFLDILSSSCYNTRSFKWSLKEYGVERERTKTDIKIFLEIRGCSGETLDRFLFCFALFCPVFSLFVFHVDNTHAYSWLVSQPNIGLVYL